MLWGVDDQFSDNLMEPLFRTFFDWCKLSKIPVVLSAGNNRNKPIQNTVPQKLGTSDNTVITVGGVKKDGTLHMDTSPKKKGQASMTVFTPTTEVVIPKNTNLPDHGTSQADAIVFYFFDDDSYASNFQKSSTY
ncbi:hypothetical protein N0V90_002723 [Kalmusia sp. IMI 367209]|nr:hypothetical protein N0V90_002723 [Kalmusia sp. IMI 367209]